MREIVGVVANVRQSPLGPEPEPIYYLPLRQMTWGQTSFIVRTSVPPMTLEPSVRKLVATFDKDVTVAASNHGGVAVSGTSVPRFAVTLMSAFSMIAIVLIATGVYGLLTYAVLRRSRELGIRLALGATRRGVIGLVLARAAKLTTTGLLFGIVGSVATARVLRARLPGVGRTRRLALPGGRLDRVRDLAARRLPAGRPCGSDRSDGRVATGIRSLKRSHSTRRGSIGLTDAARRAGTKLATSAATARSAATPTSVGTSHGVVANSSVRISQPSPIDAIDSNGQSGDDEASGFAENQLVDRTRLGAEREAQSDFACSLTDRIGNDPIESDEPSTSASPAKPPTSDADERCR